MVPKGARRTVVGVVLAVSMAAGLPAPMATAVGPRPAPMLHGPDLAKTAGLARSTPGALAEPHFTSSLSISVAAGQARPFTVTAAGKPTPTVFVPLGALPPGMAFSGGPGGRGTLAGTPTKLGKTSFEIGAASAAGITLRKMSVLTRPSPGKPITSYRAVKGEAFRLTLPNPTVTAPSTGSISCTGHFPAGVAFTSSRGGLSGALSGDPQSTGRFSIICSARAHTTGTAERWALVLVVSTSRTPPTCPSLSRDEVAGTPFALTVQVRGTPTPSAAQSGAWPPGVSLVDNGNGTGSISGVVAVPGSYHLRLAESNAAGRCSDVFGLIVAPKKPTFESPASAMVPVHTLLEFPVIASGIPTARISIVGPCKGQACSQWPHFPSPLQIKTSNGVPVLVGSPQKPGTIRFALKAANDAGSATQAFTLAVVAPSTTTTSSTTTSSTTTSTSSTTTSSTTTSSTTTSTSSTTTSSTPTSSTTTPTSSRPAQCATPAGIMALCRNASGLLSAFLVGKNGVLYRYDQAASGAWGPAQSMMLANEWPDTVAPVVVANRSGELSAFLVAVDGLLWRSDQAASGAWGTAQPMGGDWPDKVPPVVVANQSGQLSAFLVGKNGVLYRYDQAASGAWGPAQSMAGDWPDTVPPVVVPNQMIASGDTDAGQLSAFLVGNNGQLYRYDQAASGAWGTAQPMGGDWPDKVPPVVVATGPFGQLGAYLDGKNGVLYYYAQAGPGAWGTAQPMAEETCIGPCYPDTVAPAVVANQSGLLSAFLVDLEGFLWRWDEAGPGAWGTAQPMGGDWPDLAPPVVVANQSGEFERVLGRQQRAAVPLRPGRLRRLGGGPVDGGGLARQGTAGRGG